LPQGVETGTISAHYEHGVLEIGVPLPAQLAGRNSDSNGAKGTEKKTGIQDRVSTLSILII
jgi:hypothetical protein